MASRGPASSNSTLSRWHPAVTAITCATAGLGIFYLYSIYANRPTPNPSPLRRHGAVHRQRHRPELPIQHDREPVPTSAAENAFRLLDGNDGNASWMGHVAVGLGEIVEVNLLPSQRLDEARRIQLVRGLSDEETQSLMASMDRAFLREFFHVAFPPSYFIGQVPGEEEWLIQQLERFNMSRRNIEDAISRHNTRQEIRAMDPDPVPTRTDGPVDSSGRDLDGILRAGQRIRAAQWEHTHDPSSQTAKAQGLLNLMYHIAEDQARRDGYVHRGVTCNSCGMMPILGIRYRCANCIDFDLCETCEAMGVHTKTHVFYKVRLPAPFLGNPRQTQQVWYPGKPSSHPKLLPRPLAKRLMRETSLENPEMDALWEQFRCLASVPWLEDPNGIKTAIDRKSFDRCFVPNTTVGCPQENLIYDRMFRFYDTNDDRLIGFEEFIKGLACLNNKNKDEKLKRVFHGYDADEDGFVSRVDFLRMFRAFYVLTKELTRDMVAGMEDEYMDNQTLDAIAASQAVSGTFSGPDVRDSIVSTHASILKHLDEERSLRDGPLEENSEDTDERSRFIGDAAERAAERANRRSQHSDASSLVARRTTRTSNVYETMIARHPDNAQDNHSNDNSQSNEAITINVMAHPRPSEGALRVLQIMQTTNRAEVEAQLSQVSREDMHEVLDLVERNLNEERSTRQARDLRPVSPELIRQTIRDIRDQPGHENAFDRIAGATSPEIRDMLRDIFTPEERAAFDEIDELAQVLQVLQEYPNLNSELSATSQDLSVTNGSDSAPSLDSWPPEHLEQGDIIEALQRDVPVEEILSSRDRSVVRGAVFKRLVRTEQEGLQEKRKSCLHERWRRRKFYVDEEEGAKPPPDFVDDVQPSASDAVDATESSSTTSGSRPVSPRSRSSSKVRFQEDFLADNDYETRSNHSNSSRGNIPVAERWGGYRMRESEKDVGKEVLYQASQQGLNELLDALFKPKEDMCVESENSIAQRQRYTDLIDKLEAEQGPNNTTLNSQVLGLLDPEDEGDSDDDASSIADQDKPTRAQQLASDLHEFIHNNELPSARFQRLRPTRENPSSLPEAPGSTNAGEGLESEYHDPTLPQFRPNTPPAQTGSETPRVSVESSPDGPSTIVQEGDTSTVTETDHVPSEDELKRYLLHRRLEAEAKERGGAGRLDFREFEEVMNGERGRRLAFVGAWIEMASFWSP